MAIAVPSAMNVDSTVPVPSRPNVVSITPDDAWILTSVAAINAAKDARRTRPVMSVSPNPIEFGRVRLQADAEDVRPIRTGEAGTFQTFSDGRPGWPTRLTE